MGFFLFLEACDRDVDFAGAALDHRDGAAAEQIAAGLLADLRDRPVDLRAAGFPAVFQHVPFVVVLGPDGAVRGEPDLLLDQAPAAHRQDGASPGRGVVPYPVEPRGSDYARHGGERARQAGGAAGG